MKKEVKVGTVVWLKDWSGRLTSDWGVVEEYDGEYYWISFAGDKNDTKPYERSEFVATKGARRK